MTEGQGRRGYRHQQSIQYLADFPGARVESDRVAVTIEGSDHPLPVRIVDETATEGAGATPSEDVEGAAVSETTYPNDLGTVQSAHMYVEDDTPQRLLGAVKSTGQYDVYILEGHQAHQDPLITDQVASGVAGGTVTKIDRPAHTGSIGVVVVDDSGSPTDQEVTGAIHVT